MIDLYNDDCLNKLKDIKNVDLIITSPPYFNVKNYSHWETYEDFLKWLREVFILIFNSLKEGRFCCVNISNIIIPRENRSCESKRLPLAFHFVNIMEQIGFKFIEDIIWEKPSGSVFNRNGGFFRNRQPLTYKPNCVNEYIFVFQKPCDFLIDKIIKEYKYKDVYIESLVSDNYEKTNIWKINPETKSKHPAPFPLKLSDNLIRYYSYKNDIILDPFMGSGTVGVSCKLLNRSFIGIELNKKYFCMVKSRIENTINLFDL